MKQIYKIMLFLAMFQFSALIVGSLGVFPREAVLYSDVELEDISDIEKPEDFLGTFFSVPNIPGLELSGTMTFGLIVGTFLGIGIAVAWATHSFIPIVVAFLGISFIHMISNSLNFFNSMFDNYSNNTMALTYLLLAIGVAVVLIMLITIVEVPTQGGSD